MTLLHHQNHVMSLLFRRQYMDRCWLKYIPCDQSILKHLFKSMRSSMLVMCLLGIAIAQSCTPLISQQQVFATVGETLQWDLWKTIFDGTDLKYTIEKNDYFDVRQPVSAADAPTTHVKGSQILAFVVLNKALQVKAQTFQVNGAWTNKFAVFNYLDTESAIVVAGGNQLDVGKTPSFDQPLTVYKKGATATSDVCFDFVWLVIDGSDVFLADCALKGAKFSNQFYLTSQSNTPISNPNVYGESEVTARILRTYTTVNPITAATIIYVLRATPYYGITDAKTKSVLEVFALDDANKPVFQFLLDGATLTEVVGIKTDLELVDVQVLNNGHVYVFDKSGAIYVLTFNASGEWTLIDFIHSPLSGPVIAFSLNFLLDAYGSYSTQIGYLGTTSFVITTTIKGQTTPTVQTYPLPKPTSQLAVIQFAVSQGYALIQDGVEKVVYVYSTTSSQVLSTLQNIDPTTIAIVNPFLPQVVWVTLSQAYSFRLSKGALFSKGSTTTTKTDTNVKVTATSGSQACTFQLVFRLLAQDDNSAVPYTLVPKFPNAITYPFFCLFSLSGVASGPALTFTSPTSQFLEATSDLTVFKQWELKTTFNKVTPPAPADVSFNYVLKIDGTNTFYQFLQTKTDNKVNTWKCNAVNDPVPSSTATCEPLVKGQFAVSKALTIQNFQAWPQSENVVVTLLSDPHTVQLWGCDDSTGCGDAAGEEFPYPNDEVSGFTVLSQFLYVVIGAKNFIDVYELQPPFAKVFQINAAVLQAQGFVGTFAPKSVYGNKEQNPSLVFIDNGDSLIIVDFYTTLNLIDVIKYPDFVPTSVQLGVGANSFFLITASDTASSIEQYNYQDLSNIYRINTVPLNGLFTIKAPLYGDFTSQSGLFFLSAQDAKAKPVVLVLKPDVPVRDALYSVIPITTTAQTFAPLVSANGGSNIYLYVNYGDVQTTYQVLPNSLLLVNPQNIDANVLVSTYKFNLQISDINAKTTTFTKQWKVLNTQIAVKINTQANLAFTFKDGDNQFLPLPDDIVQGQVTKFEITCTDCGTKILFINRVQPNLPAVGAIKGITDFDGIPGSVNKYAQTADSIYPVANDLSLVGTIIKLQLPKNTKCTLVAAQGDYIASICSDGSKVYAYLTSCLSDCTPVGAIELPEVTATHKAAFIGNSLLVLNSNQDPNVLAGSLLVYNLQASDLTFKLVATIDGKYLQSVYPVSVTDFTFVTTTDSNNFRLFVLDANGQLFILDGAYSQQGQYFLPSVKVSSINLRRYLNSDLAGQYFADNSLFLRISTAADAKLDDKKIWTQPILITSNNVAHFVFNILYDYSDAAVGGHLSDYSITKVLNRYGTWNALNRLKVSGDSVVIPYANDAKIVHAVYNLSTTTTVVKADGPTVISMVGGAEQPATTAAQGDVFLYFVKNGDQTQLYLNDPTNPSGSLQSHDINPKAGLKVVNGTGLASQKVSISAVSDFSKDTAEVDVTHDDDNGSSGGFKWYWILLIVLGGVLVIGGIVFFVCKKKTKTEDRLLD